MKINLRVLIVVLMGMMLIPSVNYASVDFYIDLNAGNAAYDGQDNITKMPGDTLTADVFLALSDSNDSLTSFSYSLWWDNTEIGTPSNISTYAFDTGWYDNAPLDQDDSHIYNFGQYTMGTSSGVLGPNRVASVTWDVKGPEHNINSYDIEVEYLNAADGAYDGQFNQVGMENTNFNGAKVAVAPEPVSSILFLSGGAVLGIRRFRKR